MLNLIKNTIYIITDSPIPIGMAATNRILSYAKGFNANGVNCEIIIFRKTEKAESISNHDREGNSDGFKFQYLFKSPIKSKHFLKRRIDNFNGAVRLLCLYLFKIKSNSAIIYYSSHTYAILLLKLAKLFKPSILLKEESEHPDVRYRIQNRLRFSFLINIHYRLFDGYLLMTQALIKYFSNKYPKIPLLHCPMTVDMDRFSVKNPKESKLITYIGSLNDDKDGVNILIESFSIVIKTFPDHILSLYGEAITSDGLENYINKAEVLSIPKNNIHFFGRVESSSIPQILSESKLVLLARPNSKQAEYGFPTKLGEYLASGVPVVVTSVGEISQYLIDGESAFIAKPSDVNSFATKIDDALTNYENAIQIGIRGKKVAEAHFNNIVQTKNIIKFFNQF